MDNGNAVKRRLSAILAADAVGYSALWRKAWRSQAPPSNGCRTGAREASRHPPRSATHQAIAHEATGSAPVFAICIGRGRLATAWDRTDAGSTDGGVSLMTTEDMIVRLAYESSRWAAESERRKKILSSESESISGESTGGDDEGGPRMRNAS